MGAYRLYTRILRVSMYMRVSDSRREDCVYSIKKVAQAMILQPSTSCFRAGLVGRIQTGLRVRVHPCRTGSFSLVLRRSRRARALSVVLAGIFFY